MQIIHIFKIILINNSHVLLTNYSTLHFKVAMKSNENKKAKPCTYVLVDRSRCRCVKNSLMHVDPHASNNTLHLYVCIDFLKQLLPYIQKEITYSVPSNLDTHAESKSRY